MPKKWEKNNIIHFNYFKKIIPILFINIKESIVNINSFYLFSKLFQFLNWITILDIIFSYKRDFINFHSYIYFISPNFYLELFYNYISKIPKTDDFSKISSDNLCDFAEKNLYKKDQILKLIDKFFNIKIYNQLCFTKKYIFKFLIIIIILFLNFILIINIKLFCFKTIKKYSSIIIYIIFYGLLLPLNNIFGIEIFIQTTKFYENLDYIIIFDIIFLLIFYIFSIIFYFILIYAYKDNEHLYFYKSYIFFLLYILNIIGSIIYITRFEFKYMLSIYMIWITFYLILYSLELKLFLYDLNRLFYNKFEIFLDTFIISFLFERIISIFLKNKIFKIKIFKYFELLIVILLFLILLKIITFVKKPINLYMLEKYFNNKDYIFFLGINQLFNFSNNFIKIKYKFKKKIFTEKDKEKIIITLKKNLKENFFLIKKDYKTLNLKILEINSILNSYEEFLTTKTINNNENAENFYNLIINIYKKFYKSSKNHKHYFDNYYKYTKEYLIYYKILLYYFIDEKTFRSEYICKKFINSPYFRHNNIVIYCIFKYYEFQLKNLNENFENNIGVNDNLIYFIKINSNFLKLSKCFSSILKNFFLSKKEIIKLISFQTNKIGKYFNKIIHLNKKIESLNQTSNNYETTKFKVIENILFNSGFDKNLNLFDSEILNLLVSKNNYFIFLYDTTEFYIKKAPYNYFKITKIKTTKLKNKLLQSIFPVIIQQNMIKKLKDKIFSKKYLVINALLETYENYIVESKITFSKLTSYNGKLYFIGYLETSSLLKNNFAIIDAYGNFHKIGTFFNEYFGLYSNNLKDTNLMKILNIKINDNYNVLKDIKEFKIFELNFEKLIKNIKKITKKINRNINSFNIADVYRNLHILKYQLKNNKYIKVKITKIDSFSLKKQYMFIIMVNFEELINNEEVENSISKSNITENLFNLSENSMNSQNTFNILNQGNWNIIAENKTNILKKKNIFDILGIIYSLIILCIIIFFSIDININSNNFEKDYLNLYILREMNSDYFYNHFYLSSKFLLENDNNRHDIFYYYLLDNYNIDLNLSAFYQYNLKNESVYLLNIYKTNYLSYLLNLNKKNLLYDIGYELFNYYKYDGKMGKISYFNSFEEAIHLFITLSETNEFYIEVPIISFDNKELKKLKKINQKYLYSLVFNCFNFINISNFINLNEKKIFVHSFNNYKIKLYLFQSLSIFLIVFASVFVYCSILLTNNKMIDIIEKILLINSTKRLYLKNKIKIVKKLSLNELKTSSGIEILNKCYLNSRTNTKTNSQNFLSFIDLNEFKEKKENKIVDFLLPETKNPFTNKFLNSPNIQPRRTKSKKPQLKTIKTQKSKIDSQEIDLLNKENNNEENEEFTFFERKDQYIKYKVDIFKNAKISFIIYGSIYLFFILIFGYFINKKLNKINLKRMETEYIDDFQDLLLKYYLLVKYSILLNNTDIHNNFDTFENLTYYIINNYTELISSIKKEKNHEYLMILDLVNEEGSCPTFLEVDDYYTQIVEICDSIPLFSTNLYIILINFLRNIRNQYQNFSMSEKTKEDIIYNFYTINFKFVDFIEIIYFMDFVCFLEYSYLLPDFQKSIKNISKFIIYTFIILIFIELTNFFQNNFFIIKHLTNSLYNYSILEKFFIDDNSKDKLIRKDTTIQKKI